MLRNVLEESVENKAVCKTAKTIYFLKDGCSTRGHTADPGSQYKLESTSLKCTMLLKLKNKNKPTQQSRFYSEEAVGNWKFK